MPFYGRGESWVDAYSFWYIGQELGALSETNFFPISQILITNVPGLLGMR